MNLSLKKLFYKILNFLSIKSATPTITRTSGGTIVSTAYKRSGNVATLRIVFSSSGAVAGGANIFEGTLPMDTDQQLPLMGVGIMASLRLSVRLVQLEN